MRSPQEMFKDDLKAICLNYQGNHIKGGHFFRAVINKKPVHFDACEKILKQLESIQDPELPALAVAFQDYLQENNSEKLLKKIEACIVKYIVAPQNVKNTPAYLKYQALLKGTVVSEKPEPIDIKATVRVVGDEGVGKSRLVGRFTEPKFIFSDVHVNTVAAEFSTKIVEFPSGDKVKMSIFDCNGVARHQAAMVNAYPGTNAFIICFDLTNAASFNNAGTYLAAVKAKAPEAIIVLAGTKAELKAECVVTHEQIKKFTDENGIHSYFATSAKTDNPADNYVTNLFESVAADLIKRQRVVNASVVKSADVISQSQRIL
jgi:small GTP-binding protein